MGGIGNDIVALKTINIRRTVSPRFYNKILAAPELQLYHHTLAAIPFHYFVWLAWSVKEAAYKCLQRNQPDLVFSPVRIVVNTITPPTLFVQPPITFLEGSGFDDALCFVIEASFEHRKLYARSIIYADELIHTVVAVKPDFANVKWGIKQITSTEPAVQSFSVRQLLLDRLMPLFPAKDLKIDKDPVGIPFVLLKDKNLPVSLSHHEDWVAYAF